MHISKLNQQEENHAMRNNSSITFSFKTFQEKYLNEIEDMVNLVMQQMLNKI